MKVEGMIDKRMHSPNNTLALNIFESSYRSLSTLSVTSYDDEVIEESRSMNE
jgi:hypothetical protein